MKIKLAYVVLAVTALASCDLSSLLFSGGGDAAEEGKLEVERFYFEASENPVLAEDIEGVVQAGRIDVSLPYEVVTSNQTLSPTIVVPEGVSVFPTSAQPFGDEVTYTIEDFDGDKAVYRVFPSIDPDTLTLLRVEQPFYVSGADKVPIENYQVVQDGFSYSLEVPIEELETYTGKEIGFDVIQVPFGATGVLEPAAFGDPMPYNVSVVSRNGRYTNDYSFEIRNEASAQTGLESVTAVVREVYDWTGVYRTNQSEWNAWKNAMPTGSISSRTSLSGWPGKNAMWADPVAWKNSHSWHTAGSGGFGELLMSYKYYGSGNGASSAASIMNDRYNNVADRDAIESRFSSGNQTGITYSQPYETTIDAVFSNGGHTYQAPSAEVYAQGQATHVFDWQAYVRLLNASYAGYHGPLTVRTSFTQRWWRDRTYGSRSYFVVDRVTARLPLGATIENLYAFPSVASWSQSGRDLIFPLNNTAPTKTVGAIAVFNVIADDGSSSTQFLVVEE